MSHPRRREVVRAQKPIAVILGCLDSRVPPELICDQGLGDLFVIRTAGEVLDWAALASLEFGRAELHIPRLVVLGHQRCGALKAAIDELAGYGEAEADVRYLVEALTPAVEAGKRLAGDLWEQAGRAQIALQVDRLKRSPILAEAVHDGALRVVGAWYDLDTGRVELTSSWEPRPASHTLAREVLSLMTCAARPAALGGSSRRRAAGGTALG